MRNTKKDKNIFKSLKEKLAPCDHDFECIGENTYCCRNCGEVIHTETYPSKQTPDPNDF